MNRAAEDYIKTIYVLKGRQKIVRSIDIANELGFSRASVSREVSNLRTAGMIEVMNDGAIEFTDKGEAVAKEIHERHSTLSEFLAAVAGVDEKTAREDACGMEHFISDSTYNGIKQFIEEYPERAGKKDGREFS